MSTEAVTLGMQTSKEDDTTSQHVLPLRKLLAAHCKDSYSSEVCEFALVLRIGGDMSEFDFSGCERDPSQQKEEIHHCRFRVPFI